MFNLAFKTICSSALVLSLAACGGSSSSSDDGDDLPTPDVDVLRTFSDGSGIARTFFTQDGEDLSAMVIGPDIESFEPDSGVAAIDLSGLVFDGSNIYGDFYSGTISINGETLDAIFYQDFSGEVSIFYGADALSSAAITIGLDASNIPRTGTATYNGTNIIGNRDGSYFEDGTFAMAVDFGSRQAAISATTANSSLGGSGIALNLAEGTFQGTNLDLTINGSPSTGSLFGNFHGDGAVGVTGIYTENAANPTIAGAIAGTR